MKTVTHQIPPIAHLSFFLAAFCAGSYPSPAPAAAKSPGACTSRRLSFSADHINPIPGRGSWVWGGNATGGEEHLNPPYSPEFLRAVSSAKRAGHETFAYLEGPCGDTGGKDDGAVARCAELHRKFNEDFAQGTDDSAEVRWKPFTMRQLELSGSLHIDYCEIDNLENNVTIPLIPLLREIKQKFDAGRIKCRLVLKNIQVSTLRAIKRQLAPTPAAADFIAPFHIFEADDTGEKGSLDAAMRELKGSGAVTIISTNTDAYGSEFTDDSFSSCGSGSNPTDDAPPPRDEPVQEDDSGDDSGEE